MDLSRETKKGIIRRLVQIVVQILVIAAVLFGTSGRLDWWMAWLYLCVYVVGVCVNAAFMLRVNPELIAERSRIGVGTKGWDKLIASSAVLIGWIFVPFVAGLDMRFGWSELPFNVQLAALVVNILGFALTSWAMLTNAFFSGTVRIQEERGHVVVSEGPYRYVRHPGYVGFIVSGLLTPLILDSLWALVPAATAVSLLVFRTSLEDRTLKKELSGYNEYAERVRYRLLPGVW
ncbi:MAG: isoprenylcysteine carboxylmethyltransferase family protein [Candidatus Coatesbacteria bacterium]|nr:MAG: isoprenylcysteine carboxylmethyltransferase family protein [Candidatus Coatesbacteria bacterium]